jgi:hypothetical protein
MSAVVPLARRDFFHLEPPFKYSVIIPYGLQTIYGPWRA